MSCDRFEDARFFLLCMNDKDLIAKNPAGVARIKKKYRETLARVQKEDYLKNSITNGCPRFCLSEDGESITEYRIRKGFYTPHEIQELVDQSWTAINSPYDCTGKLFTVYIHARQTPVGLVWIHRKGLDV